MHGHASGHHTPAAETTALLALYAADQALAAGNVTTFDQLALSGATAITTAVPGPVTNPVGAPPVATLPKTTRGRFLVQGTTSGTVNANVTSGTVALRSSIDGGGTWVVQKTVELPVVTAGAASTVSSAVDTIVDLSATIGAAGAKFDLFVTLVGAGGTYSTVVSEGGLVAQELPN